MFINEMVYLFFFFFWGLKLVKFVPSPPPSHTFSLSASLHSLSRSLPFFPSGRGVSSNDFPALENLCKKIIKEKQPFERLEIKKETLLEMFKVALLPFAWGPYLSSPEKRHTLKTFKVKKLKLAFFPPSSFPSLSSQPTSHSTSLSFPLPVLLSLSLCLHLPTVQQV